MTDSIDVDTTELRKLEYNLGKVPGKAVAAVQEAVKVSAEKVAERMQADATGHPSFPDFPRTINSGLRSFAGLAIEYEIGPDKDYKRVAALGNILYFGTSRDAPVLNINVGLDAEGPAYQFRLLEALSAAMGDVGS